MKTKQEKHAGWKTTAAQRRFYYMGRVGCYNLQALIPGFMNLFLIFNGVDLAMVAVITLLVKVIDAADDMVFGFLVDKIDISKSKILSKIGGEGRYLPWMRCFMYFFPFAILLFFLLPSGLPSGAKIAWFAVTYLLFDFTYTLVDVPIQSSLMTLTEVPEERNSLTTMGFVIVTACALGTGLIQQVLISESIGLSIRSVAIACVVLFSLMMFPMPFKLKESNAELKNIEEKPAEKYTLKEMVRAVKTNRPYLINTLAQVIPALLATSSGVSLFVSFYLYGSSTAMLVPTAIGTVLMVVFQMIAPKVSQKCGNKKPLVVCTAVSCVASFAVYFAGYKNFGFIVAMTIINSAIGGLALMLRTYMALQSIEFGKYKAGRDTTGIYNAINTFTGKVTSSVASSVGLFLLSLFGWVTVNAESFADLAVQGVEQSANALNGLWIINSLVPALGSLLGLIVLLFYNLDDEDARLMGKCNAGEITRGECEAQLSRKY